MENITICEALNQFIQKYCKNCQDAHCFGPACVENTGKCPFLQKKSSKPVNFGPPRITPSL